MNELLDNFNLLFEKDIESFNNIKKDLLFPLNLWTGNSRGNLKSFINVEEGIMAGMDNGFLMKYLFLNINKKSKWIKYPKYVKKAKPEDDKMFWFKQKLMDAFNWSPKELELQWDLITYKFINNPILLNSIGSRLGLDNVERKKLGLKPIEVKLEKKKNINQRCLF